VIGTADPRCKVLVQITPQPSGAATTSKSSAVVVFDFKNDRYLILDRGESESYRHVGIVESYDECGSP
jgi:hypothetical protein